MRSVILAQFAASLLAGAATGCISVVEPVADEALAATPGWEALPADPAAAAAAAPFTGLELAEELAGGLDALEFLPGLRVATVVAGSPAEGAGIAPGDRVLRVDGVELRSLEQWQALLDATAPAARLALEIERGGAMAHAEVAVVRRANAALRPADRFVERRRLDCVARTVPAGAAPGKVGVQLEEIGEGSALRGAGLRPGDVLVELEATPLGGAQDLFRRVAAAPAGATLQLAVLEPDGARRAVSLRLPAPARHLTEISLWPLFTWRETPDERTGEVVIGDLWLIWLFRREHDGDACRTSILRFVSWESGLGALDEEAGGGEGRR